MKYIKMLGLLAVAAAALMAFAGTASATILTSPAGTTYTGTIKAESTNSSLDGSFITVSCSNSTVEGPVESHGSATTAGGKISNLTFTGCNYEVTVLKDEKGNLKAGSLEVHTEYETVTDKDGTKTWVQKSTSTGNGTLTSSGAEIAIHTSVGTCIFTTSSTDIGVLTGSVNRSGKTAVLDINSAAIPRTGGNFLCGSSGTWTGNYTVTTPDYLDID